MAKTNVPIVMNGILLLTDIDPIIVGSSSWFEWLTTAKKFTYKDKTGNFLAHREFRRHQSFWYAYKRRSRKVVKAYLGKNENLTLEKLQQLSLTFTEEARGNHLFKKPERVEHRGAESRADTSFLSLTKITAPMLPLQFISRPRLTQKIKTPLIIIFAPSGFGKSTLINEWKHTCGHPVVWLTLDEHDNQPIRFWNSVVAAFQVVYPEFGNEMLKYFGTSTTIYTNDIIVHLTNEIVRTQKIFENLGIVLDDFHYINHSEIYAAIENWFVHLPKNFRLVISGNNRPQFTLENVRDQEILTELKVDDLRFTQQEGLKYLQKYPQDHHMTTEILEKLIKHTEGWATGLMLTSQAMGNQVDRRLFIETFSGAHISMREYFIETVLKYCSPEVQTFLLKTSILKSLNGSLCNAITGQDDGDTILLHLWQENLFIIKMEEKGLYRYHELFGEMLFSQLSASFPHEVSELHLRAANWYREEFAFSDAIYHLLLIEAWEEAATLIEEMALRELEQFGEDSRLLRWLQELPESVVQKHKNLLFVYMRLANLALSQKKTEQFLTFVEKNISSKPLTRQTKDERDVLLEIKQIRKIWAQGHAFIPPTLSGNINDSKWDLFNHMYLLRPAYRQYQSFPEAPIIELFEKAQAQRNLYITLVVGGVLAKRYIFAGQLRQSEKICNQILEYSIGQREKLPETSSIALEVLSLIHLERNELDLAQRYLVQASEADPNPFSTNIPIQLSILKAKIQVSLEHGKDSLATIKAAQELNAIRPGGLLTSEDLQAYESLIAVRIGNIALAEQILKEQSDVTNHHLFRQVQAEIFLKNKLFREAEELLAETIREYSKFIVIEPLMETRVLLALAIFGQHRINQALQVIVEAVRLATPERFIHPFLVGGQFSAALLSIALLTYKLSEDSRIFIREILQILKFNREFSHISKTELEMLSLSASITIREQEILRLLNEGYSNNDIAKKLSISETTVKTHLANIYNKLDVSSRGQAVSKAKQLSLVQ